MNDIREIKIKPDLSVLDVSMIRFALGTVRSKALEQAEYSKTLVEKYNFNKTAESYEALSKRLYDEQIKELNRLTGKE